MAAGVGGGGISGNGRHNNGNWRHDDGDERYNVRQRAA
jgi:hypothetical protein